MILSIVAAGSSRICSGSVAAPLTSILAVAKPGELMDSVPYACVLSSLKFPPRSVCVRTVLPFESNSTEAFGMAAPVGSETTPEIFVTCCCCAVATARHTNIKDKAVAQLCRLLLHRHTSPVLFLTARDVLPVPIPLKPATVPGASLSKPQKAQASHKKRKLPFCPFCIQICYKLAPPLSPYSIFYTEGLSLHESSQSRETAGS